MNLLLKKNWLYSSLVVLLATTFFACEYDTRELGPAAEASFTVTPVQGKINTYLLTSTSQNTFRYEWDKGVGLGYVAGKQIDTAYFPDKGTYTIKLQVYGHNGMDTASQTITVAADDPAAMTPMKALTNNGAKTWVLAPEAGALVVGPNATDVWWSSGMADVTDSKRTCLFNDEYTFNKNGTFTFDDKGDMRVDDEGGVAWPTDIGLDIGCYSSSQIPAKYNAWKSGTHTFTVNNTHLKVMGLGAHMGLYKVGETGTSAAPENMINYEILELTPTKLVIRKAYGWGQWKFTFRPK